MKFPSLRNRFLWMFIVAFLGMVIVGITAFLQFSKTEILHQRFNTQMELQSDVDSIYKDHQRLVLLYRDLVEEKPESSPTALIQQTFKIESGFQKLLESKSNNLIYKGVDIAQTQSDIKELQQYIQLLVEKRTELKDTHVYKQIIPKIGRLLISVHNSIDMMGYNISINKNDISVSGLTITKARAGQIIIFFIVFMILLCTLFYLSWKTVTSHELLSRTMFRNNSILNSISTPVVTLDKEFKVQSWNEYAQRLFGYDQEEAIGKNLVELLKLHSMTKAKLPLLFNEESTAWEAEFQCTTNDGERRYVIGNYSAIFDKKKRWEGATVVFSDNTDTHNAAEKFKSLSTNLEKAVEEKQQALLSVYERIADAVFALDRNWNYTYLNEQATKSHGVPAEMLLGKNIWEVHPYLIGKSFYNALHEAMDTMKPVRKVLYYEEQQRWFENFIYPSQDGVSVYYNDVTEKRLKELRLEEAETLYRILVEYSVLGVYIIQHNIITYINPKCAEFVGYTQEEIMGKKTVKELIAPHRWEEVMDNIQKRLSGEVMRIQYETELLHRDGHCVPVDVYGSFIIYKGAPAIMGTMIDISDRKKSEQANKILHERLELIIKATNDAIWDWDIIQDKIIGNGVYCQLLGIDIDESVDFEIFISRVHPEDFDNILKSFHDALEKHDDYITNIYRFKNAEGEYRYINDRAYLMYDKDGKAYRMVGAMQDITDQTEARNKIIAEKNLSDNIIKSLPGTFYIFNKEFRLLRWNKNLLVKTGYTDEEFANIHIEDLFTVTDQEMMYDVVNEVLTSGESKVELNVKSKNGELTPFLLTGMRIIYEGQECVMGIGIDISEKYEAEQRLIQSEEMFRMLIEQASDGFFLTDKEGNIQMVNSSAYLLTGYKDENLIHKNITELICFEDHSPFHMPTSTEEKSVLDEGLLKTAHQDFVNVEWSLKYLPDNRVQFFVRDITLRKKADHALRVSEHKYRLLFEQNPMPLFMVSEIDNKIMAVNDAAVEFYGYDKDAFVRLHLKDIEPDELNDEKLLDPYNGIENRIVKIHRKRNGETVMVSTISNEIEYEGQPVLLMLASDRTEKIRAEEALKRSHEELRMLASYLEQAREKERIHIAREIHDELGQQITGLKMDISWLSKKMTDADVNVKSKMHEIIQLMDETVKSVRNITTKLRPSLLDDLGLVAAMEWQSEEFQQRAGIEVDLETNVQQTNIPQDIATNLFRIYQESLTNIMRHAKATKVKVHLVQNGDLLELRIADNGIGYDEKTITRKHTLGILGMKERTLVMNGKFNIQTKLGEGTAIMIVVPLQPQNDNS